MADDSTIKVLSKDEIINKLYETQALLDRRRTEELFGTDIDQCYELVTEILESLD
jgi:hypothetical protein